MYDLWNFVINYAFYTDSEWEYSINDIFVNTYYSVPMGSIFYGYVLNNMNYANRDHRKIDIRSHTTKYNGFSRVTISSAGYPEYRIIKSILGTDGSLYISIQKEQEYFSALSIFIMIT